MASESLRHHWIAFLKVYYSSQSVERECSTMYAISIFKSHHRYVGVCVFVFLQMFYHSDLILLLFFFLLSKFTGKGGSKIKEIRESTGCSIQVASDMLPNSTEREVKLTGTAEQITQCIFHICCVMLEVTFRNCHHRFFSFLSLLLTLFFTALVLI